MTFNLGYSLHAYKLICLIAKTSFLKRIVVIKLKKKSLQIAQFLWQEPKKILVIWHIFMYLSTARTTWNVARDASRRIALSLAVRVRWIYDEQSTVYLFRFI